MCEREYTVWQLDYSTVEYSTMDGRGGFRRPAEQVLSVCSREKNMPTKGGFVYVCKYCTMESGAWDSPQKNIIQTLCHTRKSANKMSQSGTYSEQMLFCNAKFDAQKGLFHCCTRLYKSLLSIYALLNFFLLIFQVILIVLPFPSDIFLLLLLPLFFWQSERTSDPMEEERRRAGMKVRSRRQMVRKRRKKGPLSSTQGG